jgi:hypothetical protein
MKTIAGHRWMLVVDLSRPLLIHRSVKKAGIESVLWSNYQPRGVYEGALEHPEFRGKPPMINANKHRPIVYAVEVRLVVFDPERQFEWVLKWQRSRNQNMHAAPSAATRKRTAGKAAATCFVERSG